MQTLAGRRQRCPQIAASEVSLASLRLRLPSPWRSVCDTPGPTLHADTSFPSLQTSLGDGGLYSLWGGLVLIAELLIILVWWKGKEWRERANA